MQSIPLGRADYFEFSAMTADGQTLTALLSENLLKRAGFTNVELYDDAVGSVLLVGNQMDIDNRDVVKATAEERVQRVIDGDINEDTGTPYRFLLCTAASDRINASETARASRRDMVAKENAEVKIAKARESRLEKLRAAQQRLKERNARREAIAAAKEQPDPEPKESEILDPVQKESEIPDVVAAAQDDDEPAF